MAIIYLFRETIWPCIAAALNFMREQRKDDAAEEIRAGINFSIILGSACYLEGVFETVLKALLEHQRNVYSKIEISEFETRRAMNVFYNRIEEDLEDRIASTMGASGYDKIFELLTGRTLSGLSHVAPMWEGVSALFKFRNVLGHGRPVTARQISAYYTKGLEEEFSGGYRATDDYLRKRGLLQGKFTDHDSEYLYLSDEAADHFWELVQRIPKAIAESFSDEEAKVVQKALKT